MIASSVGLVLLNYLVIVPLQQVHAAQQWIPAACTIVSSQMADRPDGDGGVTGVGEIVFRYTVGNQHRESRRTTFFALFHCCGDDAVLVRSNPAGAQKTCFVDPNDPSEAVLERGVTAAGQRQMLLPVPLLAIGAYFLIRGFWNLSAKVERPGYSASTDKH